MLTSTLRVCLQRDRLARTLLDGGWWPWSANPAAELPGLILALEERHGRVTKIMIGMTGWDASRPRRLFIDAPGRSYVVRLGWFETLPTGLLIATAKTGRTDLLTVPPNTSEPDAQAAMEQAAQVDNDIHAPDLLAAITVAAASPAPLPASPPPETAPGTPQIGSDQLTSPRRPHSSPGRTRRVDADWHPGMGLTPMERAVVAAAASGDVADGGEGPFNWVQMRRWGKARTIRAAVLRYLLVQNRWPVAVKGVRLHGVLISGPLDLEEAELRCPLRLDRCYLDGPRPVLRFASVSLLGMTHCHLTGLAAESLIVCTDLDLTGSTFTSSIQLAGAEVGGQLCFSEAKLAGKDINDNALFAEGIKVGGHLVLSGVEADGAIHLIGADISGQLIGSGAKLTGMRRDGNALVADTIRVGSGVFFRKEFTADGAIRLPAADIGGPLDCSSAKLNGADKEGNALEGSRIKVGIDASFDGASTKKGAIKLTGADITGQLRCRGTTLNGKNKKGDSLIADWLKVGGRVIIEKFTAAGTIRLPGADIIGRLRCGGVTLQGKDTKGRALLANGMRVGSGVWFAGLYTTCGAIYMVGADVTGDLRCKGVRLQGFDKHGNALVADRIKVTGDAVFDSSDRSDAESGSIAEGTVSLKSALVGSSLKLKLEKLAKGKENPEKWEVALDLTGAQITQDLLWKPGKAVDVKVILDGAKAGQIQDCWESRPNGYWPSASAGLLRLDGFAYNRICNPPARETRKVRGRLKVQGRLEARERLEWIGSPYKPDRKVKRKDFTTQPYEQLAAAYRQAGQDSEARQVAIARRRDLRRYGDLTPYRKVVNWLLDNSIRYGYGTWRALGVLILLYIAAWVLFCIAQHHGQLIIPIMSTKGLHPVPTAMHCTNNYPCFYPAAFAIDTVVPVINVHQATYWGPNGRTLAGHLLAIFTWVSIVLGWLLATLAVAGYTGLVRRD